MRLLEFDVNQQRLTKNKDCDFSFIVAGSAGYLRVRFNFSDEWQNCKKAASFWTKDSTTQEYAKILDENDECVIPEEVLGSDRFVVRVTGVGGTMGKKYKLKTNEIKIRQEV